MRSNVTFRSTFPVDKDAHPVGEELAEFVADLLRRSGVAVMRVEMYEDVAWIMKTGPRGRGPDVVVGYLWDGEYEWLVQIGSGVGLIGRLLGRSDLEAREQIVQLLHQLLTKDKRFSDVRWHEGDFAKPGWSPTPE